MKHPEPNDSKPSRDPVHSYIIWGILGALVGPIAGAYSGCRILMSTMGGDYWIAGIMYGGVLGFLAGPIIPTGLRYLLMRRG